jgi:lysophospholipase L1-like esterase
MKKLLRPELLLLGIATVISLVACEVVLRAFVALSDSAIAREVRQADPFAIQVRPDGDFGFRQKPNGTFRYQNGTVATSNAQGYRGPVVDSVKAPGTTRIVLLGGSSTHGWGVVDDSTLDTFMRSELAERAPDLRVEVVNLAFDGYDSQQFVQRLRVDGIPLEPDIIIVNAGANDVRNSRYQNLQPRDERTLLWEPPIRTMREEERRGGPTVETRLKRALYLARVPGIVKVHVRAMQTEQPQGPIVPNFAAADYYEQNLQEIVELAAAQGACLVLSTEPSALKWLPPDSVSEVSYWVGTAAQTQQVRDTLGVRMQSVADRAASSGQPVWHIGPDLPQTGFLDDSHLAASGYRELARILVDEIVPPIRGAEEPDAPVGRQACAAQSRLRRPAHGNDLEPEGE